MEGRIAALALAWLAGPGCSLDWTAPARDGDDGDARDDGNIEGDVRPDGDADTNPDVDAGPDADVDADSPAEADAEAGAEAGADVDAEAEADGESCLPGFADCNPIAIGCETDIRTDSANCGGCGMTCFPGRSCAGGLCTCNGTGECPEDEHACTAPATCGGIANCVYEVTSGCLIDDVCWADRAPRPGDPCTICDEEISRTAWTSVPDGTVVPGGSPSWQYTCWCGRQQNLCDCRTACSPAVDRCFREPCTLGGPLCCGASCTTDPCPSNGS